MNEVIAALGQIVEQQGFRLMPVGPNLPGRLFLCTGEKDSKAMTGDLLLLEQQLAAKTFKGLEIISRRFPRKDHYNVVPEAFETGRRGLFGAGKR